MFTIRTLTADDGALIEEVAALLVDGSRAEWPDAWPDLPSVRAEVQGL